MADWKVREAERFASGEYEPLPPEWRHAWWFQVEEGRLNHFAHLSKKHPGMVAYTPSDAYGEAGRKIRMKPGRYLAKFYGEHLSAHNIKMLTDRFNDWAQPAEVKFAETADEIEYVYTHGPHSCMAHDRESYESPFHPVRVYAAGDLAVAYLDNGGRITARTLVWPDKKIYSEHFYGHEGKLEPALQRLGYEPGSLVDARLTRCLHRGDYVVPYIDDTQSANDCGDCLRIARHGDIDCGNTNGLSSCRETFTCDWCGDEEEEESVCYVYRYGEEQRWCQHCYRHHSSTCNDCVDRISNDEIATVPVGGRFARNISLCDNCIQEWSMCDCCEKWYRQEDLHPLKDHPFDNICETCGENKSLYLNDAGEWVEKQEELELA